MVALVHQDFFHLFYILENLTWNTRCLISKTRVRVWNCDEEISLLAYPRHIGSQELTQPTRLHLELDYHFGWAGCFNPLIAITGPKLTIALPLVSEPCGKMVSRWFNKPGFVWKKNVSFGCTELLIVLHSCFFTILLEFRALQLRKMPSSKDHGWEPRTTAWARAFIGTRPLSHSSSEIQPVASCSLLNRS